MKNWMDIVPKWQLGEEDTVQDTPMQAVGYTGNGGDGIVEPRKPVSMVQSTKGPMMLHEGEGTIQNPDGSIKVVPQKDLMNIEQQTGMPGMADGGTFMPVVGGVTDPTKKTGADYFDKGMQAIGDIAAGNSKAMKSYENTATQDFAGQAITSMAATKQGAAQTGSDMQAIGSLERSKSRDLEGELSKLKTTIAQTKQTSADNAAGQLVSGGLQGRSQDLQESQYQDNKKQADWDRMLLYYDPSTPEGLSQLQSAYTQMFGGNTPDFNVLKEQRDYAQKKQQQDIKSGDLMISAQDLQNISTQLGINTATSQAIAEAINTGATKDYIKQRFGVDLTDTQFNSLSQSYGQKIQLGTLSITAQSLQNTASQLGIDTQKMQNVITAINSGATKSYLQSALGISLTDEQFKALQEQYVQKIQLGNLTVTSQELTNTAAQLGIDTNKSQAIIQAINSGATKDLIQQQFGVALTDNQFNSMQKKYLQSITAGDYELEQLKTSVGDQKFNSVISRIAAGSSISSINKEFGTSITDAEYNQMWEASEIYFKKQGLTMEKAALYGYTDENGKHVNGSLENAAMQLNLQSKTFDLQKEELAKKYDLLSAEDKRAADQLYGYDVKDIKGNIVGHVKGSLELANDTSLIQKQGLDLETAQIKGYIDDNGNFIKGSVQLNAEKQGMEINSLYGYYYDPKTGQIITDSSEIARRGKELEKVEGSLSLASKTFGLQSQTYEDQRLELFGGTDPKTGKTITGKMELLSNEDQRAANQLYGYDDEIVMWDPANGKYITTTVHHAGTMELQADEVAIKKQGLSLDEAKLYGYNKNGTHIKGALEIESSKLDMLEDEYDKQQESAQGTALASHFALMANTRGYDYKNDKQAQKLLQDYWTAVTGDTGSYDKEWADRQYNASTVSEVDAAMEKMQSSDWYKTMDEKQQKNAMETVKLAAMLSITGGMTPKYDNNGKVVGLVDEEGETVLDLNPTPTDKSTAEIPSGKVAGDVFIAGNGNKYRVNDDGKTTTQIAYEDWEKSYDKVKDDPRFEELTAKGTLTAQKWKESGVSTIEEYLDYTNTKEKYGETTKLMKVTNGSLVGSDGKVISAKDYSTVLKNATDPNSPNYQVYQDLLKNAPNVNNMGISNPSKNALTGRPANGSVVNVDGRLLYVESQGRFTKGGRDADTITLIDISTGTRQRFSGRKADGNAGKSITNLSNWVTSLGV